MFQEQIGNFRGMSDRSGVGHSLNFILTSHYLEVNLFFYEEISRILDLGERIHAGMSYLQEISKKIECSTPYKYRDQLYEQVQ